MPLSKAAKEVLLFTAILTVMTAKILLALRLLRRWKQEALAEGRPFGDEEDRVRRG
jgi:hypothetical protein